MENRIPAIGQAGRCLVTPEDMSMPPFHAIITMDDNPTQVGTPLIKETLFDDENEALYELSGYDANPNNAFKKAHGRLGLVDSEVTVLNEKISTRPLQVWEFVANNATWVPPYVGRYRFYVVGGGGAGGAGAQLGTAGTGNGGVGGGGGGQGGAAWVAAAGTGGGAGGAGIVLIFYMGR